MTNFGVLSAQKILNIPWLHGRPPRWSHDAQEKLRELELFRLGMGKWLASTQVEIRFYFKGVQSERTGVTRQDEIPEILFCRKRIVRTGERCRLSSGAKKLHLCKFSKFNCTRTWTIWYNIKTGLTLSRVGPVGLQRSFLTCGRQKCYCKFLLKKRLDVTGKGRD